MDKNESGFAGGVLGFYVGVMLGLALFRFPIPHGAFAEAAAGSSPYARMFGGIPGFEIMPTEKRFEAQRSEPRRTEVQRGEPQRDEAQGAEAQRVSMRTRNGSRGDPAAAAARIAPRGNLGD